METKYIHTAWAESTIDRYTARQIKYPNFEEWMEEELASKIFQDIREKIHFSKETEANGDITYKAWLCWFDDKAALEDEAAFPRCTKDVKFKL